MFMNSMQWILLVFSLLVPLACLFFGRMMRHKPPPEPNHYWGYRTRRSLASRKAWLFANRKMGKYWVRTGLIELPATLLVFALTYPQFEWWCFGLAMLQCAFLVVPALPLVEKQLRDNFDDEGRPLNPDWEQNL